MAEELAGGDNPCCGVQTDRDQNRGSGGGEERGAETAVAGRGGGGREES